MHIHTLHRWKHSHRFNVEDTHGERNTRQRHPVKILAAPTTRRFRWVDQPAGPG